MTDGYIHGTEPGEQARLSRLNDLLNRDSLRRLRLAGGERILDVGGGLGQFGRAMARAAGRPVVAVEPDPRQRAEAVRLARDEGEADLLDVRAGDAVRMPLEEAEWGTFDVVHARFLLEHVGDPAAVVAGMVRAARPGGRIVLEDDDHDVLRVWPEPPGFARLWEAYTALFRRRGCLPDIGRRMVALLHEAGAEPVANDWLFFGGCAGDDRFDALVTNFAGLLDGAKDALLDDGLVDPGDLDRGLEAWRTWGRRPDASLWYAWAWAEGRRRDGG